MEQIFSGAAALGFFAPLAFIALFIVGTVFFVPTFILALFAGALFGIGVGFAVVLTASLAGAAAGFLAGRHLSRGWLLKRITSSIKFTALDGAVADKGWKIVLLLRLSAILPFVLMNYGLGLSKIRFKHYILASAAGMIPGVLLYVYSGSLAGMLLFRSDQMPHYSNGLTLAAFGFVMTVGMGVYSTLIVKKAFQTIEPSFAMSAGPDFPR